MRPRPGWDAQARGDLLPLDDVGLALGGVGAFLVFARARGAVLAATDLQRALEAEPWAPGGVVSLRIGIHTGEPDRIDTLLALPAALGLAAQEGTALFREGVD